MLTILFIYLVVAITTFFTSRYNNKTVWKDDSANRMSFWAGVLVSLIPFLNVIALVVNIIFILSYKDTVKSFFDKLERWYN